MASQLQYQQLTRPLAVLAGNNTPSNLEWLSPLSEPRSEKKLPLHVHAQSFVPPQALIISVPQLPFGWYSAQVENPKRNRYYDSNSAQQLTPQATVTGTQSLATSIWHQPQQKKQFFYQAKVEAPQPVATQAVVVNFGWWSVPEVPQQQTGLHVAMAGFMSGSSVQQTPFVIPPVAGWFQQLSVPSKSKPYKSELFQNTQQVFFISATVAAAPMGWLPQTEVPLTYAKPTKISSFSVEVYPPAAVTFGWFTSLAEPIKPAKLNQSPYTSFTDLGSAPAPLPSYAWFKRLDEPTKPRTIYHQFAEPVLARTNPPVLPSFGWFSSLNEPVFKKQIIMYMQTSAHTFIFFAIPADTGTMNATIPLMTASMTGNVTTFGRVIRLPNEVRILIR